MKRVLSGILGAGVVLTVVLVSGSPAKVWDANSGAEVLALKGHTGRVNSASFSPDGTRIVTCDDSSAKIWDSRPVKASEYQALERAAEIRKFGGHNGPVHNVALSADGKTAVSVGSDRTGIVWDVETGNLRHRLIGSPDQLYAAAITPDAKLAVTGGQDYVNRKDFAVRVWDTQTGKQLHELKGHAWIVARLCVTSDGKSLLSSSWDRTLRRWNLIEGGDSQVLLEIPTPPVCAALPLDLAGKNIVVAKPDGSVGILRPGEAKNIAWIPTSGGGCSSLARVSESVIAVAGGGKNPVLVDLNTKKRVWLLGHAKPADAVDAVPGGKFVVTGSQDGTVRVWNLSDGSEVSRFNPGCGGIGALCVLPDGQRVLCTGSDGTLRLWRLPLPKPGS